MSNLPTAPRQNLGDFVSDIFGSGKKVVDFLSNVMTPPGAQASRQESSSEKNKANNAFNNVAGKKAKKKHTKKKTGSFITGSQFHGRSLPLSERTKQRMARTDKKRKAQRREDDDEEEEEEISDFEEEERPKRKMIKKKKKKKRPNEDMSMSVMDISQDGEDDNAVLTFLKSHISDERKQVAEEKKQKQRAQLLRAAEQRQHSGQSALASVGKERKQTYIKKLGGNPGRHQPSVRTPTYSKNRRTTKPLEREFFLYYLI